MSAAGLPAGFVRLADIAPAIVQDIRYATPDNFTGSAVPGYQTGECWLRRDAAVALGAVARRLEGQGWQLVVFDCYRPQRAVAAFAAWARDPAEQSRKTRNYPAIDKQDLLTLGYIARVSAHSTGLAVDAGARSATGEAVDFGTEFDLFDPRSATAAPGVSKAARANRQRLVAAFAANGFVNYRREWWHFGWRSPDHAPPLDVPVAD